MEEVGPSFGTDRMLQLLLKVAKIRSVKLKLFHYGQKYLKFSSITPLTEL